MGDHINIHQYQMNDLVLCWKVGFIVHDKNDWGELVRSHWWIHRILCRKWSVDGDHIHQCYLLGAFIFCVGRRLYASVDCLAISLSDIVVWLRYLINLSYFCFNLFVMLLLEVGILTHKLRSITLQCASENPKLNPIYYQFWFDFRFIQNKLFMRRFGNWNGGAPRKYGFFVDY